MHLWGWEGAHAAAAAVGLRGGVLPWVGGPWRGWAGGALERAVQVHGRPVAAVVGMQRRLVSAGQQASVLSRVQVLLRFFSM